MKIERPPATTQIGAHMGSGHPFYLHSPDRATYRTGPETLGRKHFGIASTVSLTASLISGETQVCLPRTSPSHSLPQAPLRNPEFAEDHCAEVKQEVGPREQY